MKTYAVDFETYYDNECSITTLGPRGYFSHPDFDPYLVTVVGDDGFVFAGDPKTFDWTMLSGQRVLMHNASFDESLYLFGVDRGWFPKVKFGEVNCTADMCAFLGLPRSLKGAVAEVLGHTVDKSVRDNMKGKHRKKMSDEFFATVVEYAIKDSELCLQLWQKVSGQWPEFERRISATNRLIGQRGIPIDTNLLQKNLEHIKVELFNAEQAIPWIEDATPLSRKAFNQQCRLQGIEPPKSLAQDSDEADAWFAAHQQACPWARAVQNYRRINAFMRKLESFSSGTMEDSRFYGGFMYFGASTGRYSGSGGNLNLQNLPRGEMFGINFRKMIRPANGNKFVVADLSQIEVRTLCWLAGDKKALDTIRDSNDIYHAFGVLLGLHDPSNGELKEYDPELRHKIKSIVLGCGYGMGANRFSEFSGLPMREAEEAVRTYRNRMKKIVKLWGRYDEALNVASAIGEEFSLDLPSGRALRYGKLKRMRDSRSGKFRTIGKVVRNGRYMDFPLWGGILSENLSQGLARDIFSDMMLRVEAAGYKIIMHVHDELVVESPEDQIEQAYSDVLKIMSTAPDWIPDIPLASEAKILSIYTK